MFDIGRFTRSPCLPQTLRQIAFGALVGLAALGAPATALDLGTAVQRALQHNPTIRASDGEVNAARARVDAEAANFDPRFEVSGEFRLDRETASAPVDESRSSMLGAGFDVVQQQTSGVEIGAGVDLRQERLRQQLRDQDAVASFTDPTANTARLRVFMTVPLGRGFGSEQTRFGLASAELEREARLSDRQHRVAEVVGSVIDAYWVVRAAQAELELAQTAEQRRRAFIAQIERLIASDQRPASDRNLALATLTDQISARLASEQALAVARIRLADLLAIPIEELAAQGLASTDFPDPDRAQPPAIDRDADSLARMRADLRAAETRHQAAVLRLRTAQLDQRPDLSLNLDLGVNSRLDGGAAIDVINPDRRYAGPNAGARIAYRWAPGERAVHARIAEGEALVDVSLLGLRAQHSRVRAAISTSREDLHAAAQRVESAREAVALFQVAVEGERSRYTLGVATLIDLLELEDRVDRAVSARISRESDYARALGRWLFESAQLLEPLDVAEAVGFEVRIEPLLGH